MRTYDIYRCSSLNIATPVDAYVGSVRVHGNPHELQSAVRVHYGVAYIYEARLRMQEDDYTYKHSRAGTWIAQTDILPFRAERSTKRLAEAAARQHRDSVRKTRLLPTTAYEMGFATRFRFS